jgi:beta-galactosidase
VLAPRTGVKDRCNAVPERPFPAWLDELAGLEVTAFMSVDPIEAVSIDGGSFHGWFEELELRGATALATYVDGPFDGGAAIAEHAHGDGATVYVAGVADEATLAGFYRTLAERIELPVLDVPAGVEVVPLAKDGEELLVLLNHSSESQRIELGQGRWQAYLGDAAQLPPFGVALLGQEIANRPAAALADA